MKCFEINLLLYNPETKITRDIRQYFHQEKGSYQAIQDSLCWTHREMKKIRTEFKKIVIDRLMVWQWEIATPTPEGIIGTRKIYQIINWSFEKGIINLNDIKNKHIKNIERSVKYLNKYRHIRSQVIIEEIG